MSVQLASQGEIAGAVVERILVVDDDLSSSDAIKAVLEANHFNVLVARDGGQAQATFTMRQPDLVIMDVMLPQETGFEICEPLKILDPRIPVVFLTAVDLDEARQLAHRVGADGYLIKPVSPQRLLEQIHESADLVWQKFHSVAPAAGKEEMVRFACACGKRFKFAAVHRGKSLTCSACGNPVMVPRHD